MTAADGKAFSYTYDNWLKSVNGNAIALGYDGNNNRVSKTVSGVTTNYLVDELSPSGYAQVVEEQVAGTVRKAYVWGHMLISPRQLVAGNWVTHSLMEEWSATRGTDVVHELTQGILNAVVAEVRRPKC